MFANGGMAVPVSKGGGPVVVLPEVVELLALEADPEELEVVVVVCEGLGNEGFGVGVGEFDVGEGEGGCGAGTFKLGVVVGGAEVVGPGCLLRTRSRCLRFSFSAFIRESCKAEKKTSA
jgi:hypothetical protein